MKKPGFFFLLLCSIIIISISILLNFIIGMILLSMLGTIYYFIKKPQTCIERLILSAIFLAPCSNIFVIKTGYIDLKILQFFWLGIFTLILIHKEFFKTKYLNNSTNYSKNMIYAVYIAGIMFSCLFSMSIKISIKELFQYIYLFLLMLVIYKQAQKPGFLDKIVNVLILSNVFLIISCLISYYSGSMLIPAFKMYPDGHITVLDQLYKTQALVESKNIINRIDGVMGLDTIAIANCILIQAIAINYKIRKARGKLKSFYILLFLANILTLSLTYSRAALLLFVVFNIITLLGKNHKVNFAVIVISLCCIPIALSLFPSLYERMLEALNPQEGSTKYHFVYWLIAIRQGYDHLLTGIGLGNAAYNHDAYAYLFEKYRLYKSNQVDVHNFVLQVWAEQGIIGLICNLLLVTYPIIRYIRLKFIDKLIPNKTLYDFLILSYITTLTYNLTNNNFYLETFWVMAALVYACNEMYCSGQRALQYKTSDNYPAGGFYEKTNLKADF